jgi:putative SOS response-associated peptidase YedK
LGAAIAFEVEVDADPSPQPGGFLTTAANAVVEPIHPKAMPVILTTDEERDVWNARVLGRGNGVAAATAG